MSKEQKSKTLAPRRGLTLRAVLITVFSVAALYVAGIAVFFQLTVGPRTDELRKTTRQLNRSFVELHRAADALDVLSLTDTDGEAGDRLLASCLHYWFEHGWSEVKDGWVAAVLLRDHAWYQWIENVARGSPAYKL